MTNCFDSFFCLLLVQTHVQNKHWMVSVLSANHELKTCPPGPKARKKGQTRIREAFKTSGYPNWAFTKTLKQPNADGSKWKKCCYSLHHRSLKKNKRIFDSALYQSTFNPVRHIDRILPFLRRKKNTQAKTEHFSKCLTRTAQTCTGRNQQPLH